MKLKHLLILIFLFFISISNSSAQQIIDGVWAPYGPNSGNTDGTIIEIKFHPVDSSLFATGFFTEIQGENHSYIAYRDSSNWQSLGNGLIDAGHSIEFINDTLYSVGYQSQIDSNWLFYYDNTQWHKLGEGFYLSGANINQFYTCNLFDVIEWNNQIVVCGEFDRVGEDTIYGIAAWDGQKWNALGKGLAQPFFGSSINPHQLMVDAQGDLWVCGNFIEAGDSTVNGIARWDGNNWHPVGQGFNNTVYAMIEYQNEIYVGGAFTRSGSDTLLRAAKWSVGNWVNPGIEFDFSNSNRFCFIHTIKEIGAIANVNEGLVFAGGFNRIKSDNQGTLNAGNIGLLANSGDIFSLDEGLNGEVEGIEFSNGNLIAAGLFTASKADPGTSLGGISKYSFLQGIEKEVLSDLAIYPNPGLDKVYVDIEANVVEIHILDMYGKKQKARISQVDSGFTIDVSTFKSGVYLISISEANRQYKAKLTID